jgi:hypothetical protein
VQHPPPQFQPQNLPPDKLLNQQPTSAAPTTSVPTTKSPTSTQPKTCNGGLKPSPISCPPGFTCLQNSDFGKEDPNRSNIDLSLELNSTVDTKMRTRAPLLNGLRSLLVIFRLIQGVPLVFIRVIAPMICPLRWMICTSAVKMQSLTVLTIYWAMRVHFGYARVKQ